MKKILLTLLFLALPFATGASAQATPQAGRWVAQVSNGYKGDEIQFTVKAGRIEGIIFKGYWRCGSSPMSNDKTIEHTRTGPPKGIAIRNGTFSNTQTVPSWWWEFIGSFKTPTSAEGTYRQASGGGSCDSYKLKWTAKRVGR